MKVSYISDLHLDFHINELNPESPKFQKQLNAFLITTHLYKGGDVLLIAGDLGHYFSQDTAFLLKVKTLFNHVMLVPGNHDMYLISKSIKKKYRYDSYERIAEMKRFCNENDIHYLDGDVVSIDGIKFGGVGMSWDKSYIEFLRNGDVHDFAVEDLYKNVMNDAKLILEGADTFYTPMAYGSRKLVVTFNQQKYFNDQMEKLKNIEAADVMVSHYTPVVPDGMKLKYAQSESSTFYMFNGEDEVKRLKPKYWIYGHMHNRFDFVKHDTNFLCNPLGYPGENTYAVVQQFDI